jgi:hypothetical protein
MVECQPCQHDVVCHVPTLEKEQRLWMDLDQQVLFGSGCSQSVWQFQEFWSANVEGRVGLRTRTERINHAEPFAHAMRQQQVTDVPAVLHRDGMGITIQQSHETITADTRHRQRKKRQGKKQVILVALGFWPDSRRAIVEWQMASREQQHEWEVLVHRRWERGCPQKRGCRWSCVMAVEREEKHVLRWTAPLSQSNVASFTRCSM